MSSAAPRARDARSRKVVLFTGYSCSNRCAFCIDADKRLLPDRVAPALVAEMARGRAWGADYLEIIGGEASIRTDFLALVRAARRVGYRDVVTATNGRRFSYADFARRAVDAGLTGVIVSVHGPDAALHDALTAAPGSFAQLMAGGRNLRAAGLGALYANTTVVRPNAARLPEMARVYLELGVRGVEIIFVDPGQGGAANAFEALVPTLAEAAPAMRALLDAGRAAGTRDWTVRYVPLCHFVGYEDQVSETRERRTFRTMHLAPDFSNSDVSASRAALARAKPAACGGCRLFIECEGLWTEYLRRRGGGELCPVP
jgi:cyclic pyranopterin phosphate synthase